jgi:copper transport protein
VDPRRGRSWGLRLGATVLLVLGVLLWPAPASAHATLVSTTPTDGSHLDQGPAEVAFTLNEAVSVVKGSPQVIDQDGKRFEVDHTDLSADRTVVTVRFAKALPDGSFLATARLLSLDTHVVSVSAAFTVGVAGGLLAGPGTEVTSTGDRIATYVFKLLVYLGAVLSTGVLLTTAWLWPHLRDRRRWQGTVRWGSLLLIAGLIGRLVIEAAHRSGGVTQISGEAVRSVLTVNSGFGISALVALVATIVQLNLPRVGSARRSRVVGVVTAAATVLAVTYGGHGADPALFPLPLALTVLHVYAVLAWLGGVVVILAVLRRSVPLAAWHRYALAHVALVAGTGIGLALLRIPAPAALITTAYGMALIVKVALVTLVVAAAALVYRRLARTAAANEVVKVDGVRFLGVELLLVSSVLGVTGVLSSVAPATVSYDPSIRTTVDFGAGGILDITIPSTRRGPQALIVESPSDVTSGGDTDGAHSPLSADLSSREANVARLPVRFDDGERTGSGVRWSSRDLVVPISGNWQVTITFKTPAGPRVASFHYEVL